MMTIKEKIVYLLLLFIALATLFFFFPIQPDKPSIVKHITPPTKPVEHKLFNKYDICESDNNRIAMQMPNNMRSVTIRIYKPDGTIIDTYQIPNWFITIEPNQIITIETK